MDSDGCPPDCAKGLQIAIAPSTKFKLNQGFRLIIGIIRNFRYDSLSIASRWRHWVSWKDAEQCLLAITLTILWAQTITVVRTAPRRVPSSEFCQHFKYFGEGLFSWM